MVEESSTTTGCRSVRHVYVKLFLPDIVASVLAAGCSGVQTSTTLAWWYHHLYDSARLVGNDEYSYNDDE